MIAFGLAFPFLIILWIMELYPALPAVLAVTVRRLHDTNRPGQWALFPVGASLGGMIAGYIAGYIWADSFLLGLILALYGGVALGMLGFLPLIIFLAGPTYPHGNKYGPNPMPSHQDMGNDGYAAPG